MDVLMVTSIFSLFCGTSNEHNRAPCFHPNIAIRQRTSATIHLASPGILVLTLVIRND